MPWYIWTLISIYTLGFIVVFVGHLMFLQMVTPPLALLRAIVWPIYWLTGWPPASHYQWIDRMKGKSQVLDRPSADSRTSVGLDRLGTSRPPLLWGTAPASPSLVEQRSLRCEGIRCENHPNLIWPDECDCGAGMPCPECCDPVVQDGTHSIHEAFRPRRQCR